MRFVVFLDVDGVLNTMTTVQCTPDGYKGIDDARVKILANAIEKCYHLHTRYLIKIPNNGAKHGG